MGHGLVLKEGGVFYMKIGILVQIMLTISIVATLIEREEEHP